MPKILLKVQELQTVFSSNKGEIISVEEVSFALDLKKGESIHVLLAKNELLLIKKVARFSL